MPIIHDLNDKNQVGCTSYLSEHYRGPLQWEVEKARRNRTNFQTTGWFCKNVTKLTPRHGIMLEPLLTLFREKIEIFEISLSPFKPADKFEKFQFSRKCPKVTKYWCGRGFSPLNLTFL